MSNKENLVCLFINFENCKNHLYYGNMDFMLFFFGLKVLILSKSIHKVLSAKYLKALMDRGVDGVRMYEQGCWHSTS